MRIEPVPEHDTAGAARKVAEAGDPADGAIASVDAAAVSGLIVLAERIQDREGELRSSRCRRVRPGLGPADKTSMVMAVLDEPGSSWAPWRRSRPGDQPAQAGIAAPARGRSIPDVRRLHAPADDPEVEAALKEVEHTSMLKILGSYRSAER